MTIYRSIDVEDECRKALEGHISAYCAPLPKDYNLPNLVITQTGGTEQNHIDTFTVVIDARAETEAEASLTLRNAVGILKQTAKEQETALRNVEVNTSGAWGNDPVRPDLKMCSATLLITAHQETIDL